MMMVVAMLDGKELRGEREQLEDIKASGDCPRLGAKDLCQSKISKSPFITIEPIAPDTTTTNVVCTDQHCAGYHIVCSHLRHFLPKFLRHHTAAPPHCCAAPTAVSHMQLPHELTPIPHTHTHTHTHVFYLSTSPSTVYSLPSIFYLQPTHSPQLRTARMATPSSLHHNAYVSLLQVFPCLTLEHQEPTATSPPRLPFIHLSSTLHPSSHRQLQKTQLQSPHPLTATLYYTSLRSTPYDAPPLLSTFTIRKDGWMVPPRLRRLSVCWKGEENSNSGMQTRESVQENNLPPVPPSQERDVYVKLGDNIRLCCELTQEENQAIVLHQGDKRLRSLVRVMKFRQTDANSHDFFAAHPGYSMQDITELVESLCIEKHSPGASLDDNNIEFRCELIDQMGLGSTIDEEKIVIRVFEPPVVRPLPPVLESVVNGPVSVKCSATGRPDLELRWINEATGDVYAEEKAALPSDGELELSLTLEKVTTEQDGQKLICEASTSYPPDQVAQRQHTEISVNYPPQIKFDNSLIHTALGAFEDIMVTVHGKPKAELVCDPMDLSGPRELEALPEEKPGVNRYLLRLQGVTEEDLGEHFCSATNKFGTAKESFSLTLAPSKPEVVSPAFSSHADYYLLGWRAKSKSPLRNVTFHIQTFNDQMGGKATAKKTETRTVSLNDYMVARGNTSSKEVQEFWHHLANLTFDAEHAIHIRACNDHDCNEFDLQIPDVTFRTMKEYSSNKIDPDVLAQPPSAALRAAAFRDFNADNDHALSTSSTSLLVLLALSFATNL
ncbi:hypothetical protein TcWFU_010147 [Taenia crassiceps]|uniref:Ig-like domain-containing protein n=1 Tax=Taenia crassiceps TaxID=6207 RepID=A0ABR4Q8F4_9CEST